MCKRPVFNVDSKLVLITLRSRFDVSISAGRELDGDSRGYRSAEEQARELTRSIRREVNKLSEQWNALIERSDAWKRKLDDTANVSTLPSFYVHRKPLTLEPHYPIWIQIFWFRRKPLGGRNHRRGNKLSMVCAPVSIKLPRNFETLPVHENILLAKLVKISSSRRIIIHLISLYPFVHFSELLEMTSLLLVYFLSASWKLVNFPTY